MLIFYFGILPLINFMFLSTKEASALKEKLITPDFIPADSSIKDIVP